MTELRVRLGGRFDAQDLLRRIPWSERDEEEAEPRDDEEQRTGQQEPAEDDACQRVAGQVSDASQGRGPGATDRRAGPEGRLRPYFGDHSVATGMTRCVLKMTPLIFDDVYQIASLLRIGRKYACVVARMVICFQYAEGFAAR